MLDEASAGAPAEEARAVRLTVLTHDAQGDVGVARTRRTAFGARLGAAGRALRVKRAALHRVLALSARGGGPLPAVAPEIDAAAGSLRLRIRIHRLQRVAHPAVEVSVLRHVPRREFPFSLRGEAVGVRRGVLREPRAVLYELHGMADMGLKMVNVG